MLINGGDGVVELRSALCWGVARWHRLRDVFCRECYPVVQNGVMASIVKNLQELTTETQKLAGGKAGILSKLFQSGYPVPEGFVILPSAFEDKKLRAEAGN